LAGSQDLDLYTYMEELLINNFPINDEFIEILYKYKDYYTNSSNVIKLYENNSLKE